MNAAHAIAVVKRKQQN